MNRTHFILLALATLSLTTVTWNSAIAQSKQDSSSPAPTILIQRAVNPSGCPVGFSAGHSNSLTQLRAQDAKPGTISQSLNLRMDNPTSHDIVSAQITLHGLSPHYRITPANAGSAATGDLFKQIALHLPVDAGKHAATDLRVYGFTSVQRIDLDSLTYADGTTWTASTHQPCTVVPNGLMLVAAAAQ